MQLIYNKKKYKIFMYQSFLLKNGRTLYKYSIQIALVFLCCCISIVALGQNRLINIDVKQEQGAFNRNYNFCVGAGRANEGLRADWQHQLREVKRTCGFRYLRFHGLLSDDMGVYFEDKAGNPIYNWQYIDQLFDFLLSINVKPFVELSFMPQALASGKQTIFWWKANVTGPKDYRKWDDLITALVRHWTERYGQHEVASWYFEVWNEPNLHGFFPGTQADYFKLYSETAAAVKSVSASYRVGGPATAGNAWIPDMIKFCSSQHVPLDFISTHTYGVQHGFLDVTGRVGTIVKNDPAAVWNDMQRSRRQISESTMPGLELHYTEWSSSFTPTDPLHDSYLEAAFILDKIKHAAPGVNSLSYWTFTDIFEELGPRATPFHGGFGLLNYQDIKKSAFYAYSFLNALGDMELKSNDTASIACKDAIGNIQVLFWNFTVTHPGDSVNDQQYYNHDLPARKLPPVQISLKNIPAGKYMMTIDRIGYKEHDAYNAYLALGAPSQLTREQVTQIKRQSDWRPASITLNITSKTLEQTLPMRENEVVLLTLKKMK